jgi:hypothetical protein
MTRKPGLQSPKVQESRGPGVQGSKGSGVRRSVVVAISIGMLLGVALVLWLLPKWLTSTGSVTTPAPGTPEVVADARRIRATLFCVADDGSHLISADREVPFGATPGEQARHILEAQVAAQVAAGPAGCVSPIPAGVTVRNLFITPSGDAYADVSREIITGHPGGSLNEALTVYALVNALTVNLPELTAVQILVDGKEVDTIAGHIDVRRPLTRNAAWAQKGQ